MCKPQSFFLFIIGLSAVFSFTTFGIVNPDFELFNAPLPNENFSRPAGWYSYNYVAVHSSFIPVVEHGQNLIWQIPDNNIVPIEGDYYCLLSTDDIGRDGDQKQAYMYQDFIFEPNNTIEFYYFFGSCDYIPFGDWATVNLQYYDSEEQRVVLEKEIFKIEVRDIGSFGSTDGWQLFSYYLDPNDANEYNRIEFWVEDYQDTIYKSYFAIDGIRYGYKPTTANPNNDWQVNFVDYSILMDCWDNNDINCPDFNSVDFDDSNTVDINDFNILIENWLDGEILFGG